MGLSALNLLTLSFSRFVLWRRRQRRALATAIDRREPRESSRARLQIRRGRARVVEPVVQILGPNQEMAGYRRFCARAGRTPGKLANNRSTVLSGSCRPDLVRRCRLCRSVEVKVPLGH